MSSSAAPGQAPATAKTAAKPQGSAPASTREIQRRCTESMLRLAPQLPDLVGLPSDRPTRRVVSPLTDMEALAVPQANLADLDQAVARARAAQKRWARTSARERAAKLLRLHDVLWDNSEDLLNVVQWESGKTRFHAFDEIQDLALNCRYYARTLPGVLADERRRGALPTLTWTFVMYQPKGVVGVISPWNYPLSLALADALAALAAGNAVVLKPDSNTPLGAIAAKAMLVQAGFDPDLFVLVPGRGSELGTPLIAQVDYIMFTGSTATGRKIAAQAGENLIGMSMELGGKNPMIVLPDANVDAAVAGLLRGAFSSGGQLCVSIERLYVHDAIYDQFRTKVVAAVRAMRVEASLDWAADMGVMVSTSQLETIEAQVEDALSKGATALVGGKRLPEVGSTAFAPTILEGVREGMELFKHETFGPVVSLYRFHTDEQAIHLANDTDYGLNASVWGKPDHALRVARQIEAGTVNVNEGFTAAWGSTDAPMGGWKTSGIGRRHGIEGIRKYTEPKTIAVQSRLVPIAPMLGMSKQQFATLMKVALRTMRCLGVK